MWAAQALGSVLFGAWAEPGAEKTFVEIHCGVLVDVS